MHQELYKLLERRGLTGELPENGPKGLRAKKTGNVKKIGLEYGDCMGDVRCEDGCYDSDFCINDCIE